MLETIVSMLETSLYYQLAYKLASGPYNKGPNTSLFEEASLHEASFISAHITRAHMKLEQASNGVKCYSRSTSSKRHS